MKDLLVLVADKNLEFLVKGLFPRIPKIENGNDFLFDVIVHPHRDPGIINSANDFVRPFSNQYNFVLLLLDHDGSGREKNTRETIESELEGKLIHSGWKNGACCVVISPELENWIWVNEHRIKSAINWEDTIGIYDWLRINDWEFSDHKPIKPKEAFEACLKKCQTPRSSSIYFKISSLASYSNCVDPAFLKMISQLRNWFCGLENSSGQ